MSREKRARAHIHTIEQSSACSNNMCKPLSTKHIHVRTHTLFVYLANGGQGVCLLDHLSRSLLLLLGQLVGSWQRPAKWEKAGASNPLQSRSNPPSSKARSLP